MISEATHGKRIHVDTIEEFFKTFDFEKINSLRVDKASKITNIKGFAQSHLCVLRSHRGDSRYNIYYERLLDIYYLCVQIKSNNYILLKENVI